MHTSATPSVRAANDADPFVAELTRLESEVSEINRQLDRLEAELGELAQERFEEYC